MCPINPVVLFKVI